MNYQVKRGEQTYGPYSLADLQRYVQSGNILATDLAQSEGMADWVAVSQVIGNIPVPVTTGFGAAAAPAFRPEPVMLPANLHWGIVLLLDAVTLGLFSIPWGFVQASGAKKLQAGNKALTLVSIYTASIVLIVVLSAMRTLRPLISLLQLGGTVCFVVAMFQIKSAMEDYFNSTENIGLRLSGVMTFFFNIVYLQYHINAIARWRKTGVPS